MSARCRPDHERKKYLYLMEQAQRILEERNDPRQWIESNLFIRDKHRRVIPPPFQLAAGRLLGSPHLARRHSQAAPAWVHDPRVRALLRRHLAAAQHHLGDGGP